MPIQFISSPYHLGCELPFDLTTKPDLRIRLGGTAGSGLTDEREKVAIVGQNIRNATYKAISDGAVPFLWAGDCMAPISVIAALQQSSIDPTVVWFDAHGDFNTRETSWTGYLAGMSLAMLVGRTEQDFLTEIGAKVVPEKSVILVDGRRLDPKEAELISQSQITHTSIDGLGALLHRITSPVYLHIDVDVIDPTEMPAMLYAAFNGPSIAKVLEAATLVLSKTSICAISVGITLKDNHPDAIRAVATASVFKDVLSSELIKSKQHL